MDKTAIPAEIYAEMHDLIRIGNRAVHEAQEESRKLGVPNVYSFNGILYYELPNGELSRVDPYQKTESKHQNEQATNSKPRSYHQKSSPSPR